MKMNKLSIIVGSCLLTANSIQANDFFIGAGISTGTYHNVSGDHSIAGKDSSDFNIGYVNIKAGLANENFRVYGYLGDQTSSSFKKTDTAYGENQDDTLGYISLTGNMDFFAPVHERVQLFAGPHIGQGFAIIERQYQPDTDKQKHTLTGLVYGAQAGAIFNVNDNFSIETGYRHSWTNIDDKVDYSLTRKVDNSKLEIKDQALKIDQVGSVYLSANYTF